jgi:DNA-binding NarL/FixJ family response regulator/two-component sensor histidine kinase
VDITERKLAEGELEHSRQQLRDLTAHLQSVREEERTRIAREIHDELAQILTILKIDLSWLSKRLTPDQTLIIEKTQAMAKLIDMTIQTVRRISMELRPGLLDHLGLAGAMELQAEEFQRRTGIKCEVDIDQEEIIWDQKLTIALCNILQEVLLNVLRHAGASKVEIILRETDGILELMVKDNGKGITQDQVLKPKSFGLVAIRERARSLGGSIEISGRKSKGTTVIVRIPFSGKESDPMVKILAADAHPIFIEGLKQILADTPDMMVTGAASSARELLEHVAKKKYDLVLLDISVMGRCGLDILKDIKLDEPRLPILVLSMYPEEQFAVRALKAGASGYLTKESAADELIAAIRKVSQGRKYISSSIAEKLACEVDAYSVKSSHEKLSNREYQIMLMLASGTTVGEIAGDLCLSVKTISTYRTRILEKMNMKKNAELTRYALDFLLID